MNQAMRISLTQACKDAGSPVHTVQAAAKISGSTVTLRPLPKVSKYKKLLAKPKTYRSLRDCYVFRHRDKAGNSRIYTKVSDSCAIDERTGKDSIFAGNDRVEPLYPVCCSLI